MSIVLQRLDSQDTQLHEIQSQLTYIISWIHAQSDPSSFPLMPLLDVYIFSLSLYISFIDMHDYSLRISCILN